MEPDLKPYTTATPKIGALLACLSARGKFNLVPIGTASTEIAPWFGESHVARTYFGGALASYGGYLYFGTINNPLAGVFCALMADQQGVIHH